MLYTVLIEIYPLVPFPPSVREGFSDYRSRVRGWGPVTSAMTIVSSNLARLSFHACVLAPTSPRGTWAAWGCAARTSAARIQGDITVVSHISALWRAHSTPSGKDWHFTLRVRECTSVRQEEVAVPYGSHMLFCTHFPHSHAHMRVLVVQTDCR